MQKRTKYTAEFREEAVKLALSSELSSAMISKELGINKNTNRLLRQYFPKKTDLSFHSQEVLDSVAMSLNQRPRKTLKFSTPADTLYGVVAMTG
jgi:IS30 family transposase